MATTNETTGKIRKMKASKSMLVPYAELFEVLILLNNFGCILVEYEKKDLEFSHY